MAMARTRNDIINRALTIIGAKAADEDAQDHDVELAAEALDDLIKMWQASGAHLWSRNSATLFLQPAQVRYRIGPTPNADGSFTDSPDAATEEFTISSLAADMPQSSRVVTLGPLSATAHSSVREIAVGDHIGIAKPGGGFFWTTVKTVKPQILIADTAGVPELLESGARVFYFAKKIGKALRIPDARRQQGAPPFQAEIEMVQLGRIDYLNLPNKQTAGTPVQFYYDPKRFNGDLFIWPAPVKVNEYINFTYYKPLDIFDDADDDADFPNEWILALKYNLAMNISGDIMGGIEPAPRVVAMAEDFYRRALEFDQGDAPVFFQFGRGRGQ